MSWDCLHPIGKRNSELGLDEQTLFRAMLMPIAKNGIESLLVPLCYLKSLLGARLWVVRT
jgi:hypothetical protein